VCAALGRVFIPLCIAHALYRNKKTLQTLSLRGSASAAIAMQQMNENTPRMRLIAVDEYAEFNGDNNAFYDEMASNEEVHDNTLFWSRKREEVCAAFELRQRLERDYTLRRSVYVHGNNYAIYIKLFEFPSKAAQRCRALDYFRDLEAAFAKVEVVFGQRETGLLNVFFPRQVIPNAWRRFWLKEDEEGISLRVARYGAYTDVTLQLVDRPFLFNVNVEGAPFEVAWAVIDVGAGVDIVERRFNALLQPKGSVLFEVTCNAQTIALVKQFGFDHSEVEDLNMLACRNISVDGQEWLITCVQLFDDGARIQFIISGRYADMQTTVSVWRALLSKEIGTITREECAPRDGTWRVVHDKSLIATRFELAHTRWWYVCAGIRDVVIALLPLELPPYIILELLDFSDRLFACQSEYNKVNLIVAVIASARKVVARRQERK